LEIETMTTNELWAQADSFHAIAERAKVAQFSFPFNGAARDLWKSIERAARRLRVETIERAASSSVEAR
jgi:hypothetical protein